MVQKVGVLVVGAGVIGSSVAMHLARLGVGSVRVIDPDLEGTLSSSELNAGGVRATFNQPLNIEMSKATIDYFAQHAEDVGYRACGYLWLSTAEKMPAFLKAMELQQSMGWPVEAWGVSELKRRMPYIDRTDGVAGAVFAPRDGLVNPNLLKNHFRARARELGVVFDDRTLLRECAYPSSAPSGSNEPIRLIADQWKAPLTEDSKLELYSRKGTPSGAERVEYQADHVINCAGPWAMEVAKILGYHCPFFAVRRQICIFDCRDVDLTPYGMVIDTSGVYFHPEAANGLAGFANHDEPHGLNYHYDGESFFMETIWPALYERSSGFERLKHLTGWAGQYEVSPDESAILGKVRHGQAGESGRVFEAHSFSGHGVMHSYSAGLALAELMVKGRYETLDASPLGGDRFQAGRLLRETAVI